jgi:hypothetical protein
VIIAGAEGVGRIATSGTGVSVEELVVIRAGTWRMLVPVQHVLRIHPAAMPAARPSATPRAPVVAVEGDLLPVAFAAALAGAGSIDLAGHHQLVELGACGLRGLLWVDAAEDVIAYETPAGAPPTEGLVAGWSGVERPLPILDVPRLLGILHEPDPSGKEARP